MQLTANLDQQGRILIPAKLRVSLGVSPGDSLNLDVEGDRLIVRASDPGRCRECGQPRANGDRDH